LAQAALDRGARVILVSGPVNIEPPAGADVVRVGTAQQMRDAVFSRLEPSTIAIMCAAVADFRPADESRQKIKKTGEPISLELLPTPDILAELGEKRGNRLLIGFAAETENLREYARRKLEAKKCDMIVANLAQSALDSDTNEVLLVSRAGETELPRATKRRIADGILTELLKLRK
jgi:phosphopantothenoylcysteine decarboxylase/phosphopantothenate--cysteine ligase